MAEANVPESVFSGYWGKCHCQGIAVDRANRAIYYSFTTKLIKTDFSGNLMLLWRIAQQLSRLCMPAACVASLNHEIADDTVEEHAVVGSLAHLMEEIVAVEGCLVV